MNGTDTGSSSTFTQEKCRGNGKTLSRNHVL